MRRKKKKLTSNFTLLNKIALGLNCMAALLLLLSYLAPSTDPRDYAFIAVLGLGFPVLFIVNFLFVIYWLITNKVYSTISLISIFIGYSTINLFFNFGTSEMPYEQKAPNTIRIMQYNVHEFLGIEKHDGLPIHRYIFETIKTYQPDIISFEDFAESNPDRTNIIDSLKKILKSPYYYFKSYKTTKLEAHGNAIFSKYPIIDTGEVVSPILLNNRAIYADIKYANKPFRLYCLHLASIKGGKARDRYLNGKVDINKTSAISGVLISAFITRSYQIASIKRSIEKCPYPFIIAGDFNDTPNSFSVNEIGDGLKNAFLEKGSGLGTTYYSTLPLHIDHLFTSSQFDILNYLSIDKKISDHKPIISDLKLNN